MINCQEKKLKYAKPLAITSQFHNFETNLIPEMKKLLSLSLLAGAMTLFSSHAPIHPGVLAHIGDEADSTKATRDTSVAIQDTLREVEVTTSKELPVVDIINRSLNNDLTVPRQKSVSDVIGAKTTDYIMHPFAWKDRRREKRRKRTDESLKKLEAAKTFEEEMTEAILLQLKEDSIAEAKKKQKQ